MACICCYDRDFRGQHVPTDCKKYEYFLKKTKGIKGKEKDRKKWIIIRLRAG